MLVANAVVLANLAAKHRTPLIGLFEAAEAGGLMAYAASFPAIWHRAAFFADRILKGSKPENLPVEQHSIFDLTVNGRNRENCNPGSYRPHSDRQSPGRFEPGGAVRWNLRCGWSNAPMAKAMRAASAWTTTRRWIAGPVSYR